MRLPWPTIEEVGNTDPDQETLKLLRWWHHLPEPDSEDEALIVTMVKAKLNEADRRHVEVIAKATGYAT